MTSITTEQFQSFTAARHALFTAIMDAALLNRRTEIQFEIEPISVSIIPDTEPTRTETPKPPKDRTERTASHSAGDPILDAEEVDRLGRFEQVWFIEALLHSLRGGVAGEPRITVTAPDITIVVKHTPDPSFAE
jgi:hypothetical protein